MSGPASTAVVKCVTDDNTLITHTSATLTAGQLIALLDKREDILKFECKSKLNVSGRIIKNNNNNNL